MKSVLEIKNLKDKKIFLRVDFNITLPGNKATDLYRIKESQETIKYLVKNGAKVFLVSHFQDPEKFSKKFSLDRILKYVKKFFPYIEFLDFKKTNDLLNGRFTPVGKIFLLENIRFFGDKENDLEKAKNWSKNFDIYVNEAFSASHREHISTYLLSKFLPTYFGFNFIKEVKNLSIWERGKDIILVLGGSKISTKYQLLKNFQKEKLVKKIILGGALLNFYLKQIGFDIKKSYYDKDFKEILSPEKILYLDDVVFFKEKIVDLGKDSLKKIEEELKDFKGILVWNGPLGVVEKKPFDEGTKRFAKFLVKKKFFKIVGGGDTISFLNKIRLLKKFNYVSTGGGAMLYFLAHRTLPILNLVRK